MLSADVTFSNKGYQVLGKFQTSLDHVLAELERIDVIILARLRQVKEGITEDKDLRGLYISEVEIEEILKNSTGFSELDQGTSSSLPEWAGTRISELSRRNFERKEESIREGIILRLCNCQDYFGLCEFELNVILLGLVPEVNSKYERIFGYLHDDITRKRPSVEMALHLFCQTNREKIEARRYFLSGSSLLNNGLMLLLDDPNQTHPPLLSRGLKLHDRLVEFLLETDEAFLLQDEIFEIKKSCLNMEDVPIPENLKIRIGRWIDHPTNNGHLILYFQGPDGVGKQATAEAFFNQKGIKTLILDGSKCIKKESLDLAQLLSWVIREAKIQQAGVLLKGGDLFLEGEREQDLRNIIQKISAQQIPLILTGQKNWEFVGKEPSLVFLRYEFPKPGYQERFRYWQKVLGQSGFENKKDLLEDVANRFRLTYGQIEEGRIIAKNMALRRDSKENIVSSSDLYEACRMNSNRKLYSLAQHIRPRYSWEDIVLSQERFKQLEEIVRFVKYRGVVYDQWGFDEKLSLGKGVNALFAGPSGTGKTMAAEVMAHELELDLYKIDLSKIVSKYIGETEKNLSRIFEEAATSNAILFFDEADALFGRRSEVKDSHDRYANIEVGYLLQKMEEYEGIVILATNFRKNLDEAFVRRMHTAIDFQYPDEKGRQQIWEKVWPLTTPLHPNMNLEFMAKRFQLTGGNIKNVAIAAAFLAMEDGREVAMRHLLQATRREFQKMGKVLGEEEFFYEDSIV